MLASTLAYACLLLASASAQTSEGLLTIQTSVPAVGTSTAGELSILPISTSVSITLPEATTEVVPTVTGEMSIPAGETPISTGSEVSSGSSSEGTTASTTASTTSSAAASSSTAAAPAALKAGDGSALFAMVLSGLSASLGFAWTLL